MALSLWAGRYVRGPRHRAPRSTPRGGPDEVLKIYPSLFGGMRYVVQGPSRYIESRKQWAPRAQSGIVSATLSLQGVELELLENHIHISSLDAMNTVYISHRFKTPMDQTLYRGRVYKNDYPVAQLFLPATNTIQLTIENYELEEGGSQVATVIIRIVLTEKAARRLRRELDLA
jgi:hypothetical protein